MKSFCLIPEGTHNKNTFDYGKVYEVSHIKRLKEYDVFAGSIDSRIIFLSYNKGIVYSDDNVTPCASNIRYGILKSEKNCRFLAKSLLSLCIAYNVDTVFLLIDKLGPFEKLISIIRQEGIRVELPFLFR